jgi:hypothetical protein
MLKPPSITSRQENILKLLYNYRFLSRVQVQAFLGHNTGRHTNRLLKDLRDKHYIEGKYSTKFVENTQPAVYYVSLRAIQYFKTKPDTHSTVISRLYRDNARSRDFIKKSLLVADIALELQHATSPTLRYEVATASMYANPASRAHFLTATGVTPDALIVEDASGAYAGYMLEILTPGLPVHRLYGKINAYVDLYFSGEWEANTGLDFPNIILVIGTASQLRETQSYLMTRLAQEHDVEDFKMNLLAANRLKAKGIRTFLMLDQ